MQQEMMDEARPDRRKSKMNTSGNRRRHDDAVRTGKCPKCERLSTQVEHHSMILWKCAHCGYEC